ncbi:MAG: dolichol kinase [Ignavibacteriaceae bacterium]|nr:dolichol kinase [Ignavibacteriaceae bacterium]
MTRVDNGTIKYRDEILRKLIHLSSLSIPIVYYFIPRNTALIILGLLTAFALFLDIGRYYSKVIGKVFYKIFGFLLRKHEVDDKKRTLNGATYVLLSAFICVFIFPKIIVITAFAVLIVSDTMAALIGRRFGKRRFLFKSLEGTTAFFISAVIVVLLSPKIEYIYPEYIIGIIAVAFGAIIENVSFGLTDDNLVIPISIGAAMWLMYLLFLPDVNLILQNVPK